MEILEVTRVSPSSDSSNSTTEFSLPLTFFDIALLKLPPTKCLYFYQLTDSTGTIFDSVILPKLKRSLSLTLHHYLPLAGRLMWDPRKSIKPIILYTPSDTVSLTVAKSTADLTRRLSDNGCHEATELDPFIPELSVVSDYIASIISLQITVFPSQGFCIGITKHHGAFDAQTQNMFIKAWSYLCKQLQEYPSLPQELSPVFDRSVIIDPIGLDMLLFNEFLDLNKVNLFRAARGSVDSNLVRATFELSCEDINKLREKVILLRNEAVKPLRLSTFVLIYAYVFTCLVNARGGDSNRSVCIVFVADYRTRSDPPIPLNYFGNCIAVNVCVATAGEFFKENGFAIAAEKISDMVSGLDYKQVHGRIRKNLQILASLELGTQKVSVAGSTKGGFYGSDFGWGKPRKVEIVSIDTNGAFSLTESRDGSGGVEVGLCLSRHEMKIFASLFINGVNRQFRFKY